MSDVLLNRIIRLCLTVFVMSSFYGRLQSQAHDYLFHPSFYDDYLSMQALPDGKVRVFVLADQNNGWVIPRIVFSDFSSGMLDQEQVPKAINVDNDYINYFVQNPLMLRCADGSTILVSNFFDCDYGGADAIYRLNAAGEVDWYYSFWDEGVLGEIDHLAFVDSNTIFVGAYNAFMHFDMQGNELQRPLPENVLEHSLQTSYGYVGSMGDSLVIFDQQFHSLQIYLLEGDIETIEDVQLNEFRITTSAGYYILKPDLQVYSLPFSHSTYYPIWSSPSAYWGYAASQDVAVRWDTFFNPLDTLELALGVAAAAGISLADQVLVVGAYQNEIGRGVIAFQDDDEHIDFKLPQDIGITDILLEDTVLVEYFNSNVPFAGWSYHVPELTVEVQNFGSDTVRQFYMQGHDLLDCFWWCLYPHPFWSIDSLVLPPGAKGLVRLGEFVTRCGNEFNAEICISTTAPEGRADGNYLNDKFCRSFDFVLETNKQVQQTSVTLYPNPVSEYLYLDAGPLFHGVVEGQMYNSAGQLTDHFIVQEVVTSIDVTTYPSGLYVLKVKDSSGITSINKFAVVR